MVRQEILEALFFQIEGRDKIKIDLDWINSFFEEKKNIHETLPLVIKIGVNPIGEGMSDGISKQDFIDSFKIWKIRNS
jgi:hypothetical protein